MPRLAPLALAALLAAGAISCASAADPFRQPNESVSDALARARAMQKRGDITEASLLLAEVTGPDASAETLHAAARLHREAGRHRVARALDGRAREAGGDWWHLHLDLAAYARRVRDFETAAALYELARDKAREQRAAPDEIWPIQLGHIEALFGCGRRDEAILEARALARSDGPNDLPGHVALVLMEMGELGVAGELLDGLDARLREMPVIVAARATRLEWEGEARAACVLFAEMLEELDEDELAEMPFEWHRARVDCHLKAGDLPGARDALDDWSSRDRVERARRGTRGLLHDLLEGDPAHAIARAGGIGRVDGRDPITFLALAIAHTARGEGTDPYRAQGRLHKAAAERGLGQFAGERRRAQWLLEASKRAMPDRAAAIGAAVEPWLDLSR